MQAVYERVQEDIREELEAKFTETEAKHQQNVRNLMLKLQQQTQNKNKLDENYEKFENMFFEFRNMRES